MRTDDSCRIHEPALAALDEYEELALDADDVDAARAHLASCPRCQARRRMWARLDDALRDALASTVATPALTTAGLLATIGADHEPSERRTPMLSVIYVRDEEAMDDEHASATPSPATETPTAGAGKPAFAPLPTLTPHRQPTWRRALTSAAAVGVAAALIAGIAGAMTLAGHLRGAQTTAASKLKSASATQTAQAAPPTIAAQYQITALSMDSPTDGWAIEVNEMGNMNAAIVLHIVNGSVIQQTTLASFFGSQANLQALSPTDVWVTFSQGTFFYHYNGQTWTQAHLPAPADAAGNSVSLEMFHMLSPSEGWAIASYTPGSSATSAGAINRLAFYRYDGTAWRVEPAEKAATVGGSVPTGNGAYAVQFTGISATPGGDVWATGYLQTQDANGNPSSTTGYIYHRVGGVWRLAQTLSGDVLSGIAMSGPSSGWIIGQSVKVVQEGGNISPYKVTQTAPIALGWNGGRWSPAAIPQPDQTQQGMQLNQIVATSPSNVWVVGSANGTSYTAGSPYASDSTYLIHYDGSRWSRASLPQIAAINPTHDPTVINQMTFQNIALTPSGDLWMAGNLWVGPNHINQYFPLLYRYSGGQWNSIPLPATTSTGGAPSSGSQPAG